MQIFSSPPNSTIKKVTILLIIFMMCFNAKSCTSSGDKLLYCVLDKQCVTVWKQPNGKVLIIPGYYNGDNEPSESYIETDTKQYLTFYFSKEFPQKIIVRDEGNLKSNQKGYKIKNAKEGWEFSEFSEDYKKILYFPDPVKFKDVKENTYYLIINLPENYAIDKNGNKQI